VQAKDSVTDRLMDRVAQREAHPGLAARVGERVAGSGTVGAREDLTVEHRLGQRLQGEFEHVDVI